MADHELLFARVTEYGYGRLKEPPLVYSSRHGWRVASDKARAPGESPRDALLARLATAGYDTAGADADDAGALHQHQIGKREPDAAGEADAEVVELGLPVAYASSSSSSTSFMGPPAVGVLQPAYALGQGEPLH